MAKRGESVMGGKKSKSKGGASKKPHKMHIRHAANGGYIVEHHHKPDATAALGGGAPDMEEHAVPDIGALQDHVGEHMAPEAAAGGAGGGAPQMPGM